MATSKRRVAVLAAVLACLCWTPGVAAWAGAPRSIPRTLPGGAVLTPDTKHICGPSGYLLYVFPDGSRQCMHPSQLPPRSQADCPPGTKFTPTHYWPRCLDLNPPLTVHPTDAYPNMPVQCHTDADCPNGSVCYLNPTGRGGQCGEPPGYHPTVP